MTQPVLMQANGITTLEAKQRQHESIANLQKIDHIVVLMMENRSFDHLLGYLTLEKGRTDVDGLTRQMFNEFRGERYHPVHLEKTTFNPGPRHTDDAVAEQVANGTMAGFVADYVKRLKRSGHLFPKRKAGLVMGYYNDEDMPVYDHFVREFGICQRWFSALPSETWPNRAYALAGQSAGLLKPPHAPIPNFSLKTFVHYLGNQWRNYRHDFSSLRIVDATPFGKGFIRDFDNFYRDVQNSDLPSVTWLDPNFWTTIKEPKDSDDHPPLSICRGQMLVGEVYNALVANARLFANTLFIVVYDEHGGFFDHVPPPPAPDDFPTCRQYGPRVPAFLISPFVPRGMVSSQLFDHTSIMKTILLRFAPSVNIAELGARITNANHLGELLSAATPRVDFSPVTVELSAMRLRLASVPPEEQEEPSSLQLELRARRHALRTLGLSEEEI